MTTSGDSSLDAELASPAVHRSIMEAMPCGLMHVGRDGAIQLANREACRILGLGFDELTERAIGDFESETFLEDGRPCSPDEYPAARALATGKAQPPKVIGVRRSDGGLSWAVFTAVPVISPSGETEGAVVTFLDISDRKASDAELRASEAQLRSIVESVGGFLLYVDLDGTIRYINRVTMDRPVLGRSMYEFLVESDHDRVRRSVAKAIETKLPVTYDVRPLDDPRYLNVTIAPVIVDNEVIALTLIVADHTETANLRAKLSIAERMASIGTLATGVAHEINNPLTYVLASLEGIERAVLRLPDEHRTEVLDRLVPRAIEGAERIGHVVQGLRAFSQIDDGAPSLVDARSILDGAVRMANNEIRYRARLVKEYEANLPAVRVHGSKLGQVFLNLLVNAAQAIETGERDSHEIRLSLRTVGDKLIAEVRDTGHGIPLDLLQRVFEPFVTTKPVGVGSGLGLYICHNLVREMGGELELTNNPDRGTTARVTLTASADREEITRPIPIASSPPPPPSSQVLVIDDEPAIRRTVQLLLSDHQVTTAESVEEALALIDEQHFDVVVCDLVMPNHTGMDFHEELVRRDHPLKDRVIFTTGGAFTRRSREFVSSTDRPILYKPFTMQALQELVATWADAPRDRSRETESVG